MWQAQGKKWQDTGLLLTTALGLGARRQDMCVPECPGLNQIRNSPVPYKASYPWTGVESKGSQKHSRDMELWLVSERMF